jgi:hypothetical protein
MNPFSVAAACIMYMNRMLSGIVEKKAGFECPEFPGHEEKGVLVRYNFRSEKSKQTKWTELCYIN